MNAIALALPHPLPAAAMPAPAAPAPAWPAPPAAGLQLMEQPPHGVRAEIHLPEPDHA